MINKKYKKHLKLKLKKYFTVFKPSIHGSLIILSLAIFLCTIYLLKDSLFLINLSNLFNKVLASIIVGYLSTFLLWGLLGFVIYFVFYEMFQVGEELEFDIKELFFVKWPKGKNPAGPLENTLIRILFRLFILVFTVIFLMKAVVFIRNEFKNFESFKALILIFILTLFFGYLTQVLIRLLLLKNRLFKIIK